MQNTSLTFSLLLIQQTDIIYQIVNKSYYILILNFLTSFAVDQ